ncbi:MAG: hypothetical protein NZV14_18665 [Bryobacteraceae bacterium]|nr:hypothetical protein [Bryobacteraceae bacterium]MDW8380191.1 hypothetical protein [Bryobacterales bacterium]
MRLFFSKSLPNFERLLLVESGSRHLIENLLPGLRALYGDSLEVDLVTCFQGQPAGLTEGSRIFRVWDYPDGKSRRKLLEQLRARQYTVGGILCSGEPVMTKWKWWLLWKVPAKFFVMNENGDYYWFDYSNWRTMLHFLLFRAGLTGADAVTTVKQVLLFPFTVLFLVCYAARAHLRRKVRV